MSVVPVDENASQRLVRFTRRRAVQRYVRIASRLARMTPAELGHRRLLLGAGAPPRRPLDPDVVLDAAGLRSAFDARFVVGPASVGDRARRARALNPLAVAAACGAAHTLREQG